MGPKSSRLGAVCAVSLLAAVLLPGGRRATAQDDVAGIPSQALQVGRDRNQRYFLIGPKQAQEPPEEGYGLVLVMPGSDGGPDFLPFVKRIYKHALSEDYLAAQLVAVKWTPQQTIVWPTQTCRVPKMKFSTEQFLQAVIQDVAKRHRLNRRRIFTLSWSSGGPAAYAISLQEKKAVTGSYIAMSVFKPELLPALKNARGHAYLLDHSPDDRVCPFWMARKARDALGNEGARVKLLTYQGGHGWRGNIWARLREGFRWLEQETAVDPGTGD